MRSALLAGLVALALGSALPATVQAQRLPIPGGSGLSARWNGWVEFDGAYTYSSPGHVSLARTRGELAGKGRFGNGVQWKLSARAYYDAAYDATDFYPAAVRHDQGSELLLHEAYVDFGHGDWDYRIGKQNVVWGEMVGLFFADVVSAKDLREFLLQDFDQIRIPQWAARAEWFKGDNHLELVWLPLPEVDRVGVPGAEFYPYPPQYTGLGYQLASERMPARRFSNGGAGVRFSTLVKGWDLSAFAYSAPDSAPAFYRSLLDAPAPAVSYQARHDRVNRVGGTASQDFGGIVGRAEVVYSSGRSFPLLAAPVDAGNGLARLDTLDWAIGADATPADGWRVNGQLFQRVFVDYESDIGLKRFETGASLLVSDALAPRWDAEVLVITSLVRSDWMLRASLTWKATRAARVRFGVDSFGGAAWGLFGRYRDRDRVYAEYRYTF